MTEYKGGTGMSTWTGEPQDSDSRRRASEYTAPTGDDRMAIADEISGIAVGEGYYSQTIGIDAALEAADAIAPLLNRVRAEALRGYAQKRYLAFLEFPERDWLDQPEGMARHYAKVAADMLAEADRIEQNSEGETNV